MPKYDRPDWFTTNIANRVVALLGGMGLSVRGSRMLAVRGRKSGKWRTTPLNPLSLEGARYLVAPRGETEWVRNLRASGEAELRLGGKAESIRVVELADEQKPELLRAYRQRWKLETGKYFRGVGDGSPEEDFRRIAPEHPVFRIVAPDD